MDGKLTEKWRKGSRHSVPASVAADELRRIADNFGGIQPSAVVDEARAEDAPLHPEFEWRDNVAAEAWRRDQARALINDIVVVHQESASAYPVFMHVPAIEDSPPAYHKRDTVLTNADMRKASIAEALGQLESIMRRYDTLNALAGVRREIVKARQKLTTSKRAKRVV